MFTDEVNIWTRKHQGGLSWRYPDSYWPWTCRCWICASQEICSSMTELKVTINNDKTEFILIYSKNMVLRVTTLVGEICCQYMRMWHLRFGLTDLVPIHEFYLSNYSWKLISLANFKLFQKLNALICI